jgi:hypothetical protein
MRQRVICCSCMRPLWCCWPAHLSVRLHVPAPALLSAGSRSALPLRVGPGMPGCSSSRATATAGHMMKEACFTQCDSSS